MSYVEFEHLQLSRHAYNPRDRARAGDLWRIFQDAAVLGSSHCGWDPRRYVEEQVAFVVRSETAVHHHSPPFGERLSVQTWVSDFRGGRFSNRQIRVLSEGELVSACTQEWLHVRTPDLRITRASPELRQDLQVDERGGDVAFPEVTVDDRPGRVSIWEFQSAFAEMDPLGHANHPRYVDWCDEAISKALAEQGLDPHGCIPIAETVSWNAGVQAPDQVRVETERVGRTRTGHIALSHRLVLEGGRIAAVAKTVRGHDAGAESFWRVWDSDGPNRRPSS